MNLPIEISEDPIPAWRSITISRPEGGAWRCRPIHHNNPVLVPGKLQFAECKCLEFTTNGLLVQPLWLQLSNHRCGWYACKDISDITMKPHQVSSNILVAMAAVDLSGSVLDCRIGYRATEQMIMDIELPADWADVGRRYTAHEIASDLKMPVWWRARRYMA